jgi:hypothetical protein
LFLQNPRIMFRKYFLASFLLCTLFNTTNGQSLTVETYSHQLLFNVFKEQPDTAIRAFLRLYTPSLIDKKTTPTDGTPETGNKSSLEIHSFVFTRHPFFNATFTSGKLEFYCQHFSDAKGTQVYAVKLWFEFDTQQDAEIAFSKLVETFIPIATNKRITSTNGAVRAEFSDTRAKVFGKIQVRITADNLDKHHFKILFETENEL